MSTLENLQANMTEKKTDYLDWDEYFMALTFLAAKRSKDPATQVGACIINPDKRIVSLGYNGMPRGCSDDEFPWGKDTTNSEMDSKFLYGIEMLETRIIICSFSPMNFFCLNRISWNFVSLFSFFVLQSNNIDINNNEYCFRVQCVTQRSMPYWTRILQTSRVARYTLACFHVTSVPKLSYNQASERLFTCPTRTPIRRRRKHRKGCYKRPLLNIGIGEFMSILFHHIHDDFEPLTG